MLGVKNFIHKKKHVSDQIYYRVKEITVLNQNSLGAMIYGQADDKIPKLGESEQEFFLITPPPNVRKKYHLNGSNYPTIWW